MCLIYIGCFTCTPLACLIATPLLSSGPQLSDWFVWEVHKDCDIHLCHLSCWLWLLRCPRAKMRWHTCSRPLKVETSKVSQTLSTASPTGRHDWPMCPHHRMFTQSVFFSTEGILYMFLAFITPWASLNCIEMNYWFTVSFPVISYQRMCCRVPTLLVGLIWLHLLSIFFKCWVLT